MTGRRGGRVRNERDPAFLVSQIDDEIDSLSPKAPKIYTYTSIHIKRSFQFPRTIGSWKYDGFDLTGDPKIYSTFVIIIPFSADYDVSRLND